MTFWLNVLYVVLIMLPLVFEGIITTYFVDGVLKYEVRSLSSACTARCRVWCG